MAARELVLSGGIPSDRAVGSGLDDNISSTECALATSLLLPEITLSD